MSEERGGARVVPRERASHRGTPFEVNPRLTWSYRFVRVVLRRILVTWFHPTLEGSGAVPDEGPVIIAPVHRSFIDFGFSIFLTDRKLFFIAKDTLWKSRILGRFITAMGAFPVHREAADRAAFTNAEQVLEAGQVLVLFPEGTRQSGPIIGDLLEGAAFLSSRTRAPIVPVGIGGSAQALPVGSKFPRRTRVTLCTGDIIHAPEQNERGRVPRSQVHRTTEALRQALQDVFDRASA